MKTYCVIKNGIVINRIIWDGQTPYEYPEEGVILVPSETGQIGDKYENGKFYYQEGDNWIERQ